jgi:hypothetical protein
VRVLELRIGPAAGWVQTHDAAICESKILKFCKHFFSEGDGSRWPHGKTWTIKSAHSCGHDANAGGVDSSLPMINMHLIVFPVVLQNQCADLMVKPERRKS